ncbi:MAG TPA: hypothetical protein VEQ41_08320 [Solirubrobacterales bacterium]|nr:hypothetical protein [Solirubrobacterales bacterium]
MRIDLKKLGLGLLVMLAASALVVAGASAVTPLGNHFTAETSEQDLVLKGTESFSEGREINWELTVNGKPEGSLLKCTDVAYHGTLVDFAATTSQAIPLRPTYSGCSTNGKESHNLFVDVPAECGTNVLTLTSGNPGTAHVECEVKLTHKNCEIRILKQTLSGVTYTTGLREGVHSLAVDVNFPATTVHFENGICVFLGTVHTYHATGSFSIWGEDRNGEKIGIRHT